VRRLSAAATAERDHPRFLSLLALFDIVRIIAEMELGFTVAVSSYNGKPQATAFQRNGKVPASTPTPAANR
jgi:hypothetical protein